MLLAWKHNVEVSSRQGSKAEQFAKTAQPCLSAELTGYSLSSL